MMLPDLGRSTRPALCSWGASLPPFPELRLFQWVNLAVSDAQRATRLLTQRLCLLVFLALPEVPWVSPRLPVWPSSGTQVAIWKTVIALSFLGDFCSAGDYAVTWQYALHGHRFYRRCWVTFDRAVNIKEVCWNLQNIRVCMAMNDCQSHYFRSEMFFCFFLNESCCFVSDFDRHLNSPLLRLRAFCLLLHWFLTLLQLRDCELAPVVNRDLARRVRNVNGITQHKQVLRNDIKLAAKLIHALDEKGDLWTKFQEEGHSSEVDPWLISLNRCITFSKLAWEFSV